MNNKAIFLILASIFIFSAVGIQESFAQYLDNNFTGSDLGGCVIGYLECLERMKKGAEATRAQLEKNQEPKVINFLFPVIAIAGTSVAVVYIFRKKM